MNIKKRLAWMARQAETEQRRYIVLYYALIRNKAYVEAENVDDAMQTAADKLLTDMRQTGALHVSKNVRTLSVNKFDQDVYRVDMEVSVAYAAETKAENAVAAIDATTFVCNDAYWCGGWCDRSWVAVVKNENGAVVWDDADTVRRYTADFGAP